MKYTTLLAVALLLSILVTACEESPTQPADPGRVALDVEGVGLSATDDDDDDDDEDEDEEDDGDDEGREIEAEGEGITRPLFGNPFTSLNYSFEVEAEDGEVEGWIVGRGDGPGGIYNVARGDVTCITVEADGVTARIGGVITSSESNLPIDLTGQQAIWTVVAGEDGSARSTFVFISGDFPTLAQFHCDLGAAPEALGGLVPVSAEIEVEVD